MLAIGVAGWSGAGKTTLIERLIPWFTTRGLSVSVVKHAHHRFDIDRPGKDSWRHREAGASEVLITSSGRWALLHELRDGEAEPPLATQLARLAPCDLVLVEGYRDADLPKLEVHRPAVGQRLLAPADPAVIAVATDVPAAAVAGLGDWLAAGSGPWFALDDIDGIGHYLMGRCHQAAPAAAW